MFHLCQFSLGIDWMGEICIKTKAVKTHSPILERGLVRTVTIVGWTSVFTIQVQYTQKKVHKNCLILKKG